jgi:hypothetical protein
VSRVLVEESKEDEEMGVEAGAPETQNGPQQVVEADLEYKLKREEFYKKVDDEDFF